MEHFHLTSIDGFDLDAALHRAEADRELGTILQLHGITVDMDEGGMFLRLADRLAQGGLNALRFSFRGHGRSQGSQRGMTIAGEMLDLQAALDFALAELPAPHSLLAASFGAVSTCLSLPFIEPKLRGLVLWNPVLDLKRTFIEPELPWAKTSFHPESVQSMVESGFLLLDGSFEVGRVLYEEMRALDPLACFHRTQLPSLVIHGDRDTYVSYDIARNACQAHRLCTFITIDGSDHGFDGIANEDRAIDASVTWLSSLHSR